MAERRMFAKSIVFSDEFTDMPFSARTLYVYLSMAADDDGFLNNPKSVQRMSGAGDEDMELLKELGYVISFESGVIAIRDWKTNNSIKKDRYKPTVCKKEKLALTGGDSESDTEGQASGTEKQEMQTEATENQYGTQTEPEWNQIGSKAEPQDRVGKDRLGKDRSVKGSVGKKESLPDADMAFNEKGNEASFYSDTPTLKEIKDYCQSESLVYVNSEIFFNHYDAFSWRYPDGTRIKNWQALLKKWNAQDREKKGHMGRETFYGDSLYVDTSELEA